MIQQDSGNLVTIEFIIGYNIIWKAGYRDNIWCAVQKSATTWIQNLLLIFKSSIEHYRTNSLEVVAWCFHDNIWIYHSINFWLEIFNDLYLHQLCTHQCIAPGTTPRARVGDLTYMKSIASPLERILGSNAPIIGLFFSPYSL